MSENQIVVYQPNETVRLDVRLENETVWLTQSQMGELFGCTTRNVRLHLENIYSCGELTQGATRKDFFLVRQEGDRQVKRNVTCYNLDAIISVGYRVNSVLGVRFRQWATQVLKEFMLRGYAFNHRLNELEDKMDRRLAKVERSWLEVFCVHEAGLCRNPATESESVKWLFFVVAITSLLISPVKVC